MAEILLRSLAKRLSKIFLGFDRKKDLSLSFFQGASELRDLLFDSRFFNQLFFSAGIPIVLCKGYVSRVRIKANLSKLSTEPVVLRFDLVTLELMEIPNDTPLFKAQSQKDDADAKARSSKYSTLDKILDGIRIEIVEMKISFQTLGHKERLESIPPIMEIAISNLVVFSVTESWEEGDLKQCRSCSHPNKNDIYVYKKGICTLKLALCPLYPDASNIVLIDNQEIRIDIIIQKAYGKQRDSLDDETSSVRAAEITLTTVGNTSITIQEQRLAEILLFVKACQAFLLRPIDNTNYEEKKVLGLYLGLVIPRLSIRWLLSKQAAAAQDGLEMILGNLMVMMLGRGIAYETVEQLSLATMHIYDIQSQECMIWSGDDRNACAGISPSNVQHPTSNWMEFWRQQTKAGTRREDDDQDDDAHVPQESGVVEGWLWKMGWQKSSWSRWWFCATDTKLTWFTDQQKRHEQGWVPLQLYSFDDTPDPARAWVFRLIPIKSSITRRKIVLSAEATIELERWSRGLRCRLSHSRSRAAIPTIPGESNASRPRSASEDTTPHRRASMLTPVNQVGLVKTTIHPLAEEAGCAVAAFIAAKVIDCNPPNSSFRPPPDVLEFELELSILPLSLSLNPATLMLIRRVVGGASAASALADKTKDISEEPCGDNESSLHLVAESAAPPILSRRFRLRANFERFQILLEAIYRNKVKDNDNDWMAARLRINHMSLMASGKMRRTDRNATTNTIGISIEFESLTTEAIIPRVYNKRTQPNQPQILEDGYDGEEMIRIQEGKFVGDIEVHTALNPVIFTTVRRVAVSLQLHHLLASLSRRQFANISQYFAAAYLKVFAPLAEAPPISDNNGSVEDGLVAILGDSGVKKIYLQTAIHQARCYLLDDLNDLHVYRIVKLSLERGIVEVDLGVQLAVLISLASLHMSHRHDVAVKVLHECNEAFRLHIQHPAARRCLFDLAPSTVSFKASGLQLHLNVSLILDFVDFFGEFVAHQRTLANSVPKTNLTEAEVEAEVRELFHHLPQVLQIEFVDCLVEVASFTPLTQALSLQPLQSLHPPLASIVFSLASGNIRGKFGTLANENDLLNQRYPTMSMRFEGLNAVSHAHGIDSQQTFFPFDIELHLSLSTRGVESIALATGPHGTPLKLLVNMNNIHVAAIKYLLSQFADPIAHKQRVDVTAAQKMLPTVKSEDLAAFVHHLQRSELQQQQQQQQQQSASQKQAIAAYSWWFASTRDTIEEDLAVDQEVAQFTMDNEKQVDEEQEENNEEFVDICASNIEEDERHILDDASVELDHRLHLMEQTWKDYNTQHDILSESLESGSCAVGELLLGRLALAMNDPQHGIPSRCYMLPNGQRIGPCMAASEVVTWLKMSLGLKTRTEAVTLAQSMCRAKILKVLVAAACSGNNNLDFDDSNSLCQLQLIENSA